MRRHRHQLARDRRPISGMMQGPVQALKVPPVGIEAAQPFAGMVAGKALYDANLENESGR